MNASENNKQGDVIDRNPPFALKIWFYEAKISEAFYRFWCRITGGKFEKRQKERPNSCVLVTKRGFHLISTLLSKRLTITPIKLEAYQLDCPEKVIYGFGQTAYYSRLFKNFYCNYCGRCYKMQEGDKKIIGKF